MPLLLMGMFSHYLVGPRRGHEGSADPNSRGSDLRIRCLHCTCAGCPEPICLALSQPLARLPPPRDLLCYQQGEHLGMGKGTKHPWPSHWPFSRLPWTSLSSPAWAAALAFSLGSWPLDSPPLFFPLHMAFRNFQLKNLTMSFPSSKPFCGSPVPSKQRPSVY